MSALWSPLAHMNLQLAHIWRMLACMSLKLALLSLKFSFEPNVGPFEHTWHTEQNGQLEARMGQLEAETAQQAYTG